MLDYGAEISCMSQSFWQELGKPTLLPATGRRVRGVLSGPAPATLGRCVCSVELDNGGHFVESFLVLSTATAPF